MAFRSGKSGSLLLDIAGILVPIKRWSVEPVNQLQDVTNGASSSSDGTASGATTGQYAGEFIAGVSDLSFTVDFDHNVGVDPFADWAIEGANLSEVYLALDENGTHPRWFITTAIVEEVTHSLEVRGLVSVTVRCRATDSTAWEYQETA
jgi:hypothetical protein